jgi:hypothetical protein
MVDMLLHQAGHWNCFRREGRASRRRARPIKRSCLRILVDLLAWDTGGKAEVKAVKRLDRGEAGNPGEHLTGPDPPRIPFGAQDLFEKVSKRGRLGGVLSDYGIEIWNGAEPQFPGQLGQALVLQIAHEAPPAKAS